MTRRSTSKVRAKTASLDKTDLKQTSPAFKHGLAAVAAMQPANTKPKPKRKPAK